MQVNHGPYSSSRLNTARCPYRFKRQYIDRDVKDPGSPQARRGNVVHEVFEAITEGWLRKKELNWEQVEEELTKKMIEYRITDQESRMLCIEAAKSYMERPPNMLEHVYGIEEQMGAKMVDKKWVECSFDDPSAIYRGKIDLLIIKDDLARIVDHKTQPHIEHAGTDQMGGYAWLVKLHFPQVKRVETILHFCRPELSFYSKPFVWEEQDIKNVEQVIKMSIRTIESLTEFPQDVADYCQYCPLQLECDKLTEMKAHATKLGKVKKGPILSASEAIIAAGEVHVTELALKIVKGALRDFAKKIGEVHIPGKVFGFMPSHTYEVPLSADKRDLVQTLNNFGLDGQAFVKIDVTALKKVWKVLEPKQLEEIKKYLTPVTKTSFRSKKV